MSYRSGIFEALLSETRKNVPTNKRLWSRMIELAKKKFDVYPSAYANSWAAKEYKKRGGTWKLQESSLIEDLRKWHAEKWVDISRKVDGKHPPCGDSAQKGRRKNDVTSAFPKCVPAAKARSMSPEEKRSATRRKRAAVSEKMRGKKPVWVRTDRD
jgi:hypothetical protein